MCSLPKNIHMDIPYIPYTIYMDPDDYRHMTTESHGIFGTLNPNRSSWQRQDSQDFLRL